MNAIHPTEVHPEFDAPTPQNLDAWSVEQLERWREAQDAKLDAEVADTRGERAEEHRKALDVLAGVTETDPEAVTETVTIGKEPNAADIVVTKKLTGELQDTLTAIYDIRQQVNVGNPEEIDPANLRALKDNLIDAIQMLIVDDDEPDDDPYGWQDRDVWLAYYNRHGIEGLSDVFEVLVQPTLDRGDDIKNSRTQRPDS